MITICQESFVVDKLDFFKEIAEYGPQVQAKWPFHTRNRDFDDVGHGNEKLNQLGNFRVFSSRTLVFWVPPVIFYLRYTYNTVTRYILFINASFNWPFPLPFINAFFTWPFPLSF